jgi:hypothetical protein
VNAVRRFDGVYHFSFVGLLITSQGSSLAGVAFPIISSTVQLALSGLFSFSFHIQNTT